jgi:NAD(P)-dependent dehydrogenase (short-subunit alcohol dehydrogenase family)
MRRFEGKVAVVTGAASGMGRACARLFAAEGAHVVLGDLSADAGEAVAEAIRRDGGSALFVETNVVLDEHAERLVAMAVDRFGRLDFAANMAGVINAGGLFCPTKDRDRTIAVNLIGTLTCLRAEAEAMIQLGGGGVIVNCSSTGGLQGSSASPYYIAAKHGVIGITKSAALELAQHRIRVNALAPGFTRTGMTVDYFGPQVDAVGAQLTPLDRISEPEEQAEAVAWLCSEQAAFITGITLPVDGGLLAGPKAAFLSSRPD